jgi:hypothetical protein
MAFTISERRKLLGEYFSLAKTVTDEAVEGGVSDSRDRLLEIVHLYEAKLPRIPLSRCPLSGELVMHTFDPFGLDGLWWSYDAPVRPLMERFVTCLAVTGAVRLAPEVENFPFLCKPGPGVPYVYPKLLDLDGIYGVIYSTPVGRHTAYPIFYYGAEPLRGIAMPNAWGTDTYWDDSDGNPGWYSTPEAPEEWDFDLKPWIETGKLFWIAPGDPGMNLENEIAGCPYLDLPGVRQLQRIAYGKVRLDSELSQMEEEIE